MHVKIKPKIYGPLTVQSVDGTSLIFETEAGHRAPAALAPAADAMSPSDLMLAALANCIAISMRMAAQQMELELGALDLSATATKATDLPNRFGRFDVIVRTSVAVDGVAATSCCDAPRTSAPSATPWAPTWCCGSTPDERPIYTPGKVSVGCLNLALRQPVPASTPAWQTAWPSPPPTGCASVFTDMARCTVGPSKISPKLLI